MNIKEKITVSFRVILSKTQNCIEKSLLMKVLDINLNLKFKFTRTDILTLFLVSCFFLNHSTYSQNSQLQNFTTKEGLPQSQVYDIAQDSIGYLWLATQGGGLARFDGDEFTVFNEKKGLKSNFVNSLLVKNDSLYIGTYSGLSIYTKGKFINYESPKVSKVILVNHKIILATEKGMYEFKTDSIYPISSDLKIDVNPVTDLLKDKNSYYVATKNGLWNLNQLENPTSVTKIYSADFTSLLKIKNKVIATTFDKGIIVFENGKIVQEYPQFQRINNIHFIDNNYWIASDSEGIIVLDENFKIKKTINQNNGLIINQIRSILKDTQENIWIATSGGGLYKLTQNNFQHFDKNAGLKANRIYAVHSIKNEIWLSNAEKGIVKIDSLGIYPLFEDFGYINKKAKTIDSDIYGNVWIGTDGKGVIVFKKILSDTIDQDKMATFDLLDKELYPTYRLETDTITIENGLPSNWIKKIKTQGNSIWIATYSSGIMKLHYENETKEISEKTSYFGTKNGIKDLFINDLEIDKNGSIWYATKNGNIGSIFNNQVRDFYQILGKNIPITTLLIKDKNIYLGTLGDGIWIANLENPREIKQLSGTKNLNSKNIYQLIFDNDNNLWAGTEKGVNKIVLDANNSISDVFYFDRSDGFLGIETCQNAITKDAAGNIWFGTMNGLTKYIPSANQLKKVKPTISFEKIEVAYQIIDTININQYDKILQLNPTENHLSFQFKSTDINHPKGIEYRWKLNGEYSPWTSKDFIDFANLNSGAYEFAAQSRNIDWIESDVINFKFLIDKPLYEKSWFLWTVYSSLGLIIMIVFIVVFFRIRQKNKRKIAQLAMENHLLSLEQKALQLQMNPHFIFNVLNGIKAMGSQGDTQQMNSTINTFASLLRSILNSSRQEEISLTEEVKTLENYLILEQQMSTNSFEYSIHLATENIDPEEILIPPMLIQPFVENSIKHGFQQIDKKGEIEITFKVNGDFLDCTIKDNGMGIEKSKESNKQHHQSMALQVTKDRIESLSGKNSLQIKDDNGTTISFIIPLKTDF